jgi:hypothetical protein
MDQEGQVQGKVTRGRRQVIDATAVSAPLGPRAALDPLNHIDHLGPRGMAAGEARSPARLGDAPANRAGGLVELDAGAVAAY